MVLENSFFIFHFTKMKRQSLRARANTLFTLPGKKEIKIENLALIEDKNPSTQNSQGIYLTL